MARDRLELHTEAGEGVQLVIFAPIKHPEGDHIEADAYVSLAAQPAGTVFFVRSGTKIVHIRTEQPLSEGCWAFRGDPRHFDQLTERPLFYQTEVTEA